MCTPRPQRATRPFNGQLPSLLFPVQHCTQHGRIYHGPFCREGAYSSITRHDKIVCPSQYGVFCPIPTVRPRRYISVPLVFVVKELAFENVSEAVDFLSSHHCAVFTNPNHVDAEKVFDCKSASAPLAELMEEKFRKVQIKGAI